MAIILIRQDGKLGLWQSIFKQKYPDLPVFSYLERHPKEDITMAIVWKHPKGILREYPNLACIASFGAGVDFILEDETRPKNVSITRVIDPMLANDMSEYVISAIFAHLKNFYRYYQDQQAKVWEPKPYSRIKEHTVGVMGFGTLGRALAYDLRRIGFPVVGWANQVREKEEFTLFYGAAQRKVFLNKSTILVCLLPLTKETSGILNKETFSQLPKGAYVINVARGGHLNEDELLLMLDSGHLSGACLDVFHEEPMSKGHPFWHHPKIMITPHVASVSSPDSVVPQLAANFLRLQEKKPLLNLVDNAKGY